MKKTIFSGPELKSAGSWSDLTEYWGDRRADGEQIRFHKPEYDQEVLTDQTIFALSNAVEAKDRYTNGHSRRVAVYAREIVGRMGLDSQCQRQAYYAGMLHDVGKIRVSDAIINKVGSLDESEYEEIKLHTLAGYYILKEIASISYFAIAARWHHERYDGRGYPNGLSGGNIPWIARVIGVADAYDAMTSNRSYRKVLRQQQVREELLRSMGTQFDPEITRVMIDMMDDDKDYRMRQADNLGERVILAIDDDPIVLRLLEFTLSKNPRYRLVTASNGRRGMDIIQKESVDIVLLDVEMPEINGLDVLAWIREKYRSLPVIFMTGDKEIEVIRKAEAMGISDYLTKPLVMRMLHESIQNVLSASRYIQQKGLERYLN